ncbi:MAG: histidine phosphatase family protein [Gammaproteobacteria bacterium]
MTVLSLIRHGQGSFGTDNYDRLSPHGHWQAQTLGEYFASAGIAFDQLYCGALTRQRETAAGLNQALNGQAQTPRILPALDEYPTKGVFGRYMPPLLEADVELRDIFSRDRTAAGRDRSLSRRVFFPVITAWMNDTGEADGEFESFGGFCDRVSRAVTDVASQAEPDQRIAMVTSAGVIAVAVQMALNLPPETFARVAWQVHNASVTCLAIDHGTLELRRFNSTMHLEATGRADALTWL